MNPRALYGRISTIFIEPDDTTAAFNEADFLCQDYRSSFHGQSHLVRVATLLSVAILVSLFCILRIWYPDNRMENGQLQNEVKKKIIDKGNRYDECLLNGHIVSATYAVLVKLLLKEPPKTKNKLSLLVGIISYCLE